MRVNPTARISVDESGQLPPVVLLDSSGFWGRG